MMETRGNVRCGEQVANNNIYTKHAGIYLSVLSIKIFIQNMLENTKYAGKYLSCCVQFGAVVAVLLMLEDN